MVKLLCWVQGPYEPDILINNLKKVKDSGLKIDIVVSSNSIINNKIKTNNVKYLYFPDPGPDVNQYISLNYSRQFSTTAPLTEYLSNHNYDYVLKMRSDIEFFSMEKFSKLIKLAGTNTEALIVSEYSTMPEGNIFEYSWHISDWIYFGKPEIIKKYLAKVSYRDDVSEADGSKIYLQHWVGKKTCEQAMIDQKAILGCEFFKVIFPINLINYGLILPKYKHLFKPNSLQEFKTYLFARSAIYSENDCKLYHKCNLIYKIKRTLKNIVIQLVIWKSR